MTRVTVRVTERVIEVVTVRVTTRGDSKSLFPVLRLDWGKLLVQVPCIRYLLSLQIQFICIVCTAFAECKHRGSGSRTTF